MALRDKQKRQIGIATAAVVLVAGGIGGGLYLKSHQQPDTTFEPGDAAVVINAGDSNSKKDDSKVEVDNTNLQLSGGKSTVSEKDTMVDSQQNEEAHQSFGYDVEKEGSILGNWHGDGAQLLALKNNNDPNIIDCTWTETSGSSRVVYKGTADTDHTSYIKLNYTGIISSGGDKGSAESGVIDFKIKSYYTNSRGVANMVLVRVNGDKEQVYSLSPYIYTKEEVEANENAHGLSGEGGTSDDTDTGETVEE